MATIFNVKSTAEADNAWERGDGYFVDDDNKAYTYSNTTPGGTSYRSTGFRFQNITIGAGATISTAYFECEANYSSEDDPNFTLYGNDIDNAINFADDARVIARDKTIASASFIANNVPMTYYGSAIEVKTIIQEIIDRPGWSSGNAMCMLMIANTDQTKKFRLSVGETDGPNLHIEYTGGAAPPSVGAGDRRRIITITSNN